MNTNKTDKENLKEEKNITQEELEYLLKQTKIKYLLGTLIVLIIAVFLSVTITYYIYEGKKYNDVYRATEKVLEKGDEFITATDSLEEISTVLLPFAQLIDEEYIGDISKKEIVEQTIKGFINGLGDEYSEYMTQEEVEDYKTNQLGNYVGIGIYISEDENSNAVIVGVMKDSPAEKAGLKEEDIIVEVNGESVIGMGSEVVSSKVKGENGTEVNVEIYRGEEELDFTLVRQDIKVYHVEYKVLENNIAYVSLLTFDEGCAEEIKEAFNDLKNQGVKKVILDLRYNTGGYVNEALDILDMLLNDGEIELITKSADGTEKIDKAKGEKEFDFEMVVLTNDYSASASEILVGALKDNKRAIIVGLTTYGKGVIQNFYELSNGGALKLTTQEFFTPNNNRINKTGIAPDYEIKLLDEDLNNGIDTQLEKAKELLK